MTQGPSYTQAHSMRYFKRSRVPNTKYVLLDWVLINENHTSGYWSTQNKNHAFDYSSTHPNYNLPNPRQHFKMRNNTTISHGLATLTLQMQNISACFWFQIYCWLSLKDRERSKQSAATFVLIVKRAGNGKSQRHDTSIVHEESSTLAAIQNKPFEFTAVTNNRYKYVIGRGIKVEHLNRKFEVLAGIHDACDVHIKEVCIQQGLHYPRHRCNSIEEVLCVVSQHTPK